MIPVTSFLLVAGGFKYQNRVRLESGINPATGVLPVVPTHYVSTVCFDSIVLPTEQDTVNFMRDRGSSLSGSAAPCFDGQLGHNV
jgi:hypothetical protein